MARYQTKHETIDAVRTAGKGNLDPSEQGRVPEWFWEALESGRLTVRDGTTMFCGIRHVPAGHWVFRDGQGKVQSLDHESFERYFEPEPTTPGEPVK
jgi:hypothetical protein